MGTHCERNRVPHERYILPSQPTAPFRDVAFHIAAVSPLIPIADRLADRERYIPALTPCPAISFAAVLDEASLSLVI